MASILLSKSPDPVHSSTKVLDPHAPVVHPTLTHSIHEQVEVSPSSGTVAFGSTNVIFKLPREGYLGELYLDIDYAAGTTDVMPNASWYMGLVTSYEMRIGSNTVFRMNNYHEFLPYVMAKMPENKRAMFYGLAGTASAAYPSMMLPLWTPFSKMLNNDDGLSDLPLFAIEGDIELIISFAPSTATVVSGTAGTISGQVLLQRSLVRGFDRNMNWSSHSVDVQEGPARTAYTTSASRNFESHVSGSVKELYLYLTTDANQTSLDFITTALPTALNIYHDGVQIDSLNSANEVKLRMAGSMGYEINQQTAAGDVAIIHFSVYNGTSVAGSGFKIERGSLEAEVTCAAASYGRWFGLVAATYAISNGRFFKKL